MFLCPRDKHHGAKFLQTWEIKYFETFAHTARAIFSFAKCCALGGKRETEMFEQAGETRKKRPLVVSYWKTRDWADNHLASVLAGHTQIKGRGARITKIRSILTAILKWVYNISSDFHLLLVFCLRVRNTLSHGWTTSAFGYLLLTCDQMGALSTGKSPPVLTKSIQRSSWAL